MQRVYDVADHNCLSLMECCGDCLESGSATAPENENKSNKVDNKEKEL